MKQKICSIALILCLIVTMMPMMAQNAFAEAKIISEVSVVDVKTPVEGDDWTKDSSYRYPTIPNFSYQLGYAFKEGQNTKWYYENGSNLTSAFEGGKDYQARIPFQANDGYQFDDPDKMRVNINGKAYKNGDGSGMRCFYKDGGLYVLFPFTAVKKTPEVKIISEVSVVDVKTPVEGDDWTKDSSYRYPTIPNFSYQLGYAFKAGQNTTWWYGENGRSCTSAFEGGKVYEARIPFQANDGYKFDDPSKMRVNINGKSYKNGDGSGMSCFYKEDTLFVLFPFTAVKKTTAEGKISEISVTDLKTPVEGDDWTKGLDYKYVKIVNFSTDTGYTLRGSLTWLDENRSKEHSGAFEGGKVYYAHMEFQANKGFVFDDVNNILMNINGKNYRKGDGSGVTCSRVETSGGSALFINVPLTSLKKEKPVTPTDPTEPTTPGTIINPGTGTEVSTAFSAMVIKLQFASAAYNGEEKEPNVVITDAAGNKLVEDTDYAVEYYNNKLVGKATVIITGLGKYKGITAGTTFTIKPKAVAAKSLKKTAAGKLKLTWATHKTQTTGFQIMYSTNKNFKKGTYKTVTVKSKGATAKTITKLKKGKTYYVKVRAYKTVDGSKIYSSWSKAKKAKA